jgi:uncharacterized protein YlxW (UPF0749 family)
VSSQDVRATVYGVIALFGLPLLGLLWLISVTPLVVWAFLVAVVVLAGVFLVGFFTGDWGIAFSRDPEEAKRKARVRSLQHQVSKLKSEVLTTRRAISDAGNSIHGGARIHEIPPLERLLSQQQVALTKARGELNKIWKQSDGYLREREAGEW